MKVDPQFTWKTIRLMLLIPNMVMKCLFKQCNKNVKKKFTVPCEFFGVFPVDFRFKNAKKDKNIENKFKLKIY